MPDQYPAWFFAGFCAGVGAALSLMWILCIGPAAAQEAFGRTTMPGYAEAAPSVPPSALEDIVRRSQDIRANAGDILGQELAGRPAVSNALQPAIDALARGADAIQHNALSSPGYDPLAKGTPALPPGGFPVSRPTDAPAGASSRPTTYVFVSWSLGEDAIRQALELAAGRPDTFVLFRGVREGMRFADALREMQMMAVKVDPVPNITLDPTAYQRFAVASVPEVVVADGDVVIARARGTLNPQAVHERIAAGQRGDLGDLGPIRQFAERDLIEVMKERVAQIDWTQRKRDSVAKYWDHARFQALPATVEARTRVFDPSVTVTQDIKDARGKVLAAAGTVVNPMDFRPFSLRLVVFNGADPAQVATALRLAREGGNKKTVLISTEADREKSWDGWKEQENRFDAPVYLLTPDVRERFWLEYVPAVVEAEGRMLAVREYVPDPPADRAAQPAPQSTSGNAGRRDPAAGLAPRG